MHLYLGEVQIFSHWYFPYENEGDIYIYINYFGIDSLLKFISMQAL